MSIVRKKHSMYIFRKFPFQNNPRTFFCKISLSKQSKNILGNFPFQNNQRTFWETFPFKTIQENLGEISLSKQSQNCLQIIPFQNNQKILSIFFHFQIMNPKTLKNRTKKYSSKTVLFFPL